MSLEVRAARGEFGTAALIGPIVGELGTLIGGTGLAATIGRGAITGIGAVAAGDLLQAIVRDLQSGNPAAVAQARRVPQFAIVDLHSNKIVRTLSSRHVYSILTHPRRRGTRSKKVEFIQVPSGTTIERVR